jgi:hypothetical protein
MRAANRLVSSRCRVRAAKTPRADRSSRRAVAGMGLEAEDAGVVTVGAHEVRRTASTGRRRRLPQIWPARRCCSIPLPQGEDGWASAPGRGSHVAALRDRAAGSGYVENRSMPLSGDAWAPPRRYRRRRRGSNASTCGGCQGGAGEGHRRGVARRMPRPHRHRADAHARPARVPGVLSPGRPATSRRRRADARMIPS